MQYYSYLYSIRLEIYFHMDWAGHRENTEILQESWPLKYETWFENILKLWEQLKMKYTTWTWDIDQ